MTEPVDPAGLEQRIDEIARRLAALERQAPSPGDEDSGSTASDAAGEVSYRGDVTLSGRAKWRIRYGAAGVLDLPAPAGADVLAALGHPVRLQLVRRLLRGPATAIELRDEVGLSSTGKVYHHLRTLTAARAIVQDEQAFRVRTETVVPLLTLLLAAGDVAGLLQ